MKDFDDIKMHGTTIKKNPKITQLSAHDRRACGNSRTKN
jgi:hypothetical protein